MTMNTIKIDGSDKRFSRIILGGSSAAMRKGLDCNALLDAAYEAGITAFDTARGYGKSESVLSRWARSRGIADKIAVQTKGGLHGLLGNNRVTPRCITEDLNRSLDALNTDRIDLYILHRDRPSAPVGEIVGLMNSFISEGKIAAYGVSNWRADRIERANSYAAAHGLCGISVSQPHYGLAEAGRWTWLGCISITGDKYADERRWYARTQTPLFAFSPLGGGFMSGRIRSDDVKGTVKYLSGAMRVTFLSEKNTERLRRAERISRETGYSVSQIGLAWILCGELNACAITGSGSVENMLSNVKAADICLGERVRAYLNLEADGY